MIRIYKPNITNELLIDGEQFVYLQKVMRVNVDEEIHLFNKNDGEFLCKITAIERRFLTVKIVRKLREFLENKRKVFCVFAKIKQKNAELIVQKCTEIGVYGFIPMVSTRTVEKNLNIERLQKIAIEASEQCGRLDIPEFLPEITIEELTKIKKTAKLILLSQFSNDDTLVNQNYDDIYIISGPEGGFTIQELIFLDEICTKLNLSNNILRAETAAILGCGFVLAKTT